MSLKSKLFAPVPCSARMNKSSAYHFGPVRVRMLFQHYRVMADAQAPVEVTVPAASPWVGSCTSFAPFFICLFRCAIIFCGFFFCRFPLEGWQPAIFFYSRPPLSFFQYDMLAQLTAKIKTLEDAGSLSDVPARLSRITQYRFRRDALAMTP